MVMRFLAATAVAFIITSLGHYYLYSRLVAPVIGSEQALWITVFFCLWMLTLFGFPIGRAVPVHLRWLVELPMFFWMGIAYTFLILCVLTSPLNILLQVRENEGLSQVLAYGVLIGGTLLTLWSVFEALRKETVITCEVPVRKPLPASLENLRIVVINDIHVAALVGKRRVRRLVSSVNALQPDLIFVVGDLVDGSVRQLHREVEPFRAMRAAKGIYYVTGNHEYYCNPEKWKNYVSSEFGWQVLSNAHSALLVDGVHLNIIGIEDRSWLSAKRKLGRKYARHDNRLELAVKGIDEQHAQGALNLLLAHQPKDTRLIKRYPWIDLQVSGHTHAGQLWPLHFFVYKDQKFIRGLYPIEGTSQQIYVNQGTGFWGPPMRLGTKCEITLLSFKLLESA